MTKIHLAPSAYTHLMTIYGDDESLANLYDYWFDLLQEDPADPRLHRYPLANLDAWLIYVDIPGRKVRDAIVWRLVNGEVDVLHIGHWS